MKHFLSFLLFVLVFIPCTVFADPGDFSIGLSYAPVLLQGDYKKIAFDKKLPGTDISPAVYRLDLDTEIANKLSLGLDFSYLGKNKYYESSTYWYEENSKSIGLFGRYDLLRFKLGKSGSLNMFAKGGIGYYMRSFDYHKGSDEETLTAGSPGFFYSAGLDFTFWNYFVIGADCRYDKTFKKFDASGDVLSLESPAYEAYSFGINIGIRFGDVAEEEIILEDMEGKKIMPLSQFGVPPVPVEKNYSDSRKAFNPNLGGSVELDRDRYLVKAENVLDQIEDGSMKGDIALPSMGVLFKIAKGNVLQYYKDMLNYFAEIYLKTDQTAIVLVEGYSSEPIPGLSRKRARQTANYLADRGIPRKNIKIRSFGNSKTRSGIFSKDRGCKRRGCYRRVNVMIE